MNEFHTLPDSVKNSLPGSIAGVSRRGNKATGAIIAVLVLHRGPDGRAAGYSVHTPDGKRTETIHIAESARITQAKDQYPFAS